MAISRVLLRVFFLNLAVAVAKIVFGYLTGAVSILSDGFHSLTDSASNVVALVGVRVARRPPDANHPYGHRKYETMAAGAIVAFLAIVVVEIGRTAFARLRSGEEPEITGASFGVMGATLVVNLFVASYERRAGARLTSEVLFADAHHTQSDVFTSLTVIAALAGVAAGFPLLDPMAAAIVVGFIGYAGFTIARDASRILSDEMVIAEEDIRAVVMSVPEVLGCHHIRTRGTADHVFLDLHVWMAANTRLEEAHGRSHEVKDRLMTRYPQIMDAVIHIEPPPKERLGGVKEG
ncbi:MAG: cation diffusion facilitator family transporter [Vicinamibacterales bacterium]